MAVRANSAQLQIESERSTLSGNSHASFTSVVATAGGKNRHASAAGLVEQSRQPFRHETLRPFANDLSFAPHLPGHRRQRLTACDAQDDLCAYDVSMCGPQAARAGLKLVSLGLGQLDLYRRLVHAPTNAVLGAVGQLFGSGWVRSSGDLYLGKRTYPARRLRNELFTSGQRWSSSCD
jgi:hypothetical protein